VCLDFKDKLVDVVWENNRFLLHESCRTHK